LLAAIASMSGAVASATARAPATSSFQPTICVLPFVNRSGDPEQDYFSDGITEDVITDLAKVSALSVVGRNASFALKGETGDHGRLANELGVTHLLEGAVRKSGSRLRITTQLVEASGGRTLWAERFDREFTDVFEIQDEISHAIVAALRLTLLPGEKSELDERGTTNAKAYDAYLKARALWSRGDVGDTRTLDEIVRLSSEATSLDPGYASAWALTALAGAELRFWHGRDVDTLKLAEKALALDPRMAEPHCVRARGFAEQGRETEADAALNTALELDRQSWEANREAAHLLFRRGRVREALPLFEKALSAMRTEHDSATMLMACCAAIGNSVGLRNAALAAVGRAEHLIISDPANGSAFASGAYGFAVLGEEERARKWMRKALAVDPGNLSMRYTVAAAMVSCLNEQDQAVEVLEPFIESIRFPAHLALIERDPRWAAMRDKDAFQSLLGRARKRVAAVAPAALTA
jgi:adenylate cyclase